MRDLACSGSRTVSLTAVGKRTTKRKATTRPSGLRSHNTEEFSDLAEFDPDYQLDSLDDFLADDGGNTSDVETTSTGNNKRKRGDEQVSVSASPKKVRTSRTGTF